MTSTDRRQLIDIDGKPFLFQHGYRFGLSRTVWAPGHLGPSEVEAVVRGDNPWMLE